MKHTVISGVCLLVIQFALAAESVSPPLSRGYTLLSYPQKVTLGQCSCRAKSVRHVSRIASTGFQARLERYFGVILN